MQLKIGHRLVVEGIKGVDDVIICPGIVTNVVSDSPPIVAATIFPNLCGGMSVKDLPVYQDEEAARAELSALIAAGEPQHLVAWPMID